MKWIKRSDQEPEKKDDLSEKYLAWDGYSFAIINHGYDLDDGTSVWHNPGGLQFHFTHWMPLPEPPCELCDGTGFVDDSLGGVGPGADWKSPCPDCRGNE